MHVRIHDRGALSWFPLGPGLGFAGIGAAQAARIVNVGRCLAASCMKSSYAFSPGNPL
jgi:hypothetical protein